MKNKAPFIFAALISAVLCTAAAFAADKPADEKAYDKAKELETSGAARLVTGASTGMIGIGLSQAAQGMAEQNADDRWAHIIENLKNSFRCTMPGRSPVDGGEAGIAPPYSERFKEMRLAYVGNDVREGLARKVKRHKENLGLKPGIEAEVELDLALLDQQNRQLFSDEARMQNEFTGGFSTASERRESGEAEERIRQGRNLAIGGAAVGIVGNLAVENQDAIKGAVSKVGAALGRTAGAGAGQAAGGNLFTGAVNPGAGAGSVAGTPAVSAREATARARAASDLAAQHAGQATASKNSVTATSTANVAALLTKIRTTDANATKKAKDDIDKIIIDNRPKIQNLLPENKREAEALLAQMEAHRLTAANAETEIANAAKEAEQPERIARAAGEAFSAAKAILDTAEAAAKAEAAKAVPGANLNAAITAVEDAQGELEDAELELEEAKAAEEDDDDGDIRSATNNIALKKRALESRITTMNRHLTSIEEARDEAQKQAATAAAQAGIMNRAVQEAKDAEESIQRLERITAEAVLKATGAYGETNELLVQIEELIDKDADDREKLADTEEEE